MHVLYSISSSKVFGANKKDTYMKPFSTVGTEEKAKKFKQTLEDKLGLPMKPKKPMPPYFAFQGKTFKELMASDAPNEPAVSHSGKAINIYFNVS